MLRLLSLAPRAYGLLVAVIAGFHLVVTNCNGISRRPKSVPLDAEWSQPDQVWVGSERPRPKLTVIRIWNSKGILISLQARMGKRKQVKAYDENGKLEYTGQEILTESKFGGKLDDNLEFVKFGKWTFFEQSGQVRQISCYMPGLAGSPEIEDLCGTTLHYKNGALVRTEKHELKCSHGCGELRIKW